MDWSANKSSALNHRLGFVAPTYKVDYYNSFILTKLTLPPMVATRAIAAITPSSVYACSSIDTRRRITLALVFHWKGENI